MRTSEVRVFFMTTGAFRDRALHAPALRLMSQEERDTFSRTLSGAARRDYLAAHVLARLVLAETARCDPESLRIRSSPGGSLRITSPSEARGLRFSISHARGMALCALAVGCSVGVDVQCLDTLGPEPLRIAEQICSPTEMKAAVALLPAQRDEWLLWLWTLKEAIARATARGSRFPLTDIEVQGHAGRDPLTVAFGQTTREEVPGWRFASRRITDRHIASVAVMGAEPGFSARFRFLSFAAGQAAEETAGRRIA